MDNKYGEFVGVDSVHVADLIEDSEENYIADTPQYFAPVAEIASEAEVNNETTYYDNLPANNYVTEGATTLTITVSGVPANLAAKYLGKKYDPATGRVYDSGEPDPPSCALSFRFNKGSDGYRYYQYLKGNFSGGTEEAATKSGGSIDIKTYQMTFTAVATTHKWEIDGELKPQKRVFGDTTDPAFDPTNWFNTVQTPDTGGTPDALEISSSLPADEDTGVAIDVNPTITFNNKIVSSIITLVDTSTLVAVSAITNLDSTRKIVTITPDVDLSSSTEYAIMITEVKDIYGQKLQNEVITFTTGA